MTINSSSNGISGINDPNAMQSFGKMKGGGRPPKPDFNQMLTQMTKDLGLTDQQKEKVGTILKQNIEKMDAEKTQNESSNTRLTRDEMKTKMDENFTNLQSELKTILSTEQMDKFSSIMSNRNQQPPPPPDAEMQNYNPNGNFSFRV
jgi:hypothetical protein